MSRETSAPQRVVLVAEPGGRIIAKDATVAGNWFAQLCGWIGRRDVAAEAALGIPHCACVHTFGMCVTVDVAYCSRDGHVVRVVERLGPNRLSPRVRGAHWAWEMRSGAGDAAGLAGRIASGDRLILRTIERSDARSPEEH